MEAKGLERERHEEAGDWAPLVEAKGLAWELHGEAGEGLAWARQGDIQMMEEACEGGSDGT